MADDDKPAPLPATPDIVLLGPPTADGAGVHVLRAREERVETGELRPIEEGRPLTGEMLTLSPRADNPRVCDVKESFKVPSAAGGSAGTLAGRPNAKALGPAAKAKGPAQVATQTYRDNWEEVFARPPKSRADLN